MYYVNQNGDYPLISMVESFMNVYAVDLILPKMMKRFIPNHLCVVETVSYFVRKPFLNHRLKWNQGTLLECYCAGTCEEMMKRALLENWELFILSRTVNKEKDYEWEWTNWTTSPSPIYSLSKKILMAGWDWLNSVKLLRIEFPLLLVNSFSWLTLFIYLFFQFISYFTFTFIPFCSGWLFLLRGGFTANTSLAHSLLPR